MTAFDYVALVYDNTIDWDSRLEREMPFLLSAVGEPLEKRVLDIACGTGRHSIELAAWGAVVTGIDVSRVMLQRARQLADKRNIHCQFIELDMGNLSDLIVSEFDLVLCLGNSLALSTSFAALEQLLANVHSKLSEDGLFVAQVLNFEEIHQSGYRFLPVKGGETADGNTVVFFRFFEHATSERTSDLLITTFVQDDSRWNTHTSIQPVLNLDRDLVDRALANVGFSKVEMFGGFDQRRFDPRGDRNIVIRAHK